MKIFDMHIHVGSEKIEQNYLLEQMEKSGVYGGGIISACPLEAKASLIKMPFKERLENVLNWSKDHEDRFYPILWVHPEEKDVLKNVEIAKREGISAFKIICDTFPVYSESCQKLLKKIEETQKPVLFHTGILWSGTDTSRYNRPVDWECMLNLNNIKFSMGHCSWPWVDECIAVYGKFLHYYNTKISAEMFFDITPGTPEIYRRDLLTKLFTVGYDVENNIMFGTDSITNDYNPSWVKKWLEIDNKIMDELNVSSDVRKKIYEDNFMRFLKCEDVSHALPQINK